jgi:hypothetical protein
MFGIIKKVQIWMKDYGSSCKVYYRSFGSTYPALPKNIFLRMLNVILESDSLPHITICQVYSSEKVIKQIEKDLRLLQNVPQPHFTGVSFIKDKKFETIWWVELSVARDPELITLQQKVVKIVTHYTYHVLMILVDSIVLILR